MSSRRRGEPTASSTASSSHIQIAFDSELSPSHCGYCNTNGSCTAGSCLGKRASSVLLRKVHSSTCGYCQHKNGKISFGIVASTMLVDDYQVLMDRGWRKCGTYYYKALMEKTCCPLYTIRCDANNVKLSSSQRRVIQLMNQYINENIKPGEKKQPSVSTETKTPQSNEQPIKASAASASSHSDSHPVNVEHWMAREPTSNATELLRHILNHDTPPADDLVKRLRARQNRWHKKLLKLKSKDQLSTQTDIHRLIKRFDRMYTPCTLEEMLQFNDKPKNKLEFRLVRSYPPSGDFRRTLIASHAIYQRYQMAIHGDSKSECSLSQFERFLGQSSLQQQSPRLPAEKNPACGYGSFHLQYYLNDQMIACSVIDVLPAGVSSVYFYYEPSLGFLKLGVYSALKEIELTRRLAREIPDIKYYYLGFYVHSCVKMRYKGQYSPSFLLCPETYTWHPIEKCRPLLDAHKYARFESDLSKVDADEERSIEQLKLQIERRLISPIQLQAMNENYFFYILDRFLIFAKFVGRVCANRVIIDLN